MKILVTGSKGFIGKNLISELRNKGYNDIFEYDIDTDEKLLDKYTKECDFVYHLAGVNRPKEEKEFMEGNFGFTSKLLEKLQKNDNKSPILLSSSIQAEYDNPYGKSKKAGEDLLFDYGIKNDVKIYVYRLQNLFGKWSKPNYNTVVATFCYNIARDLEIKINDPNTNLNLCYIDDVVKEFIKTLKGEIKTENNYCYIPKNYYITLGNLAKKIKYFKETRDNKNIADMKDELSKKLYSTYLSFLPEDDFSYELKMNIDNRGSFTEILKTEERGQVSVNISKPGIIKGNHWHHTKNEKFLVVSGKGVIRFRKIDEEKVIEYFVSEDKLEVVDIPPGYTHNIENLGDKDMITIMWANELFDPENPDTYYLEV